MSLLLSIETSTMGCSVALHREGNLLHTLETQVPQSASSQLAVMIENVLKQSNTKSSDLNGVVVAAGPGSYTGLRIGVATAKGLCYGLDIPLMAINTLELLSYQVAKSTSVRDSEYLLCPMIDARRMEVYTMLQNHQFNILMATEAMVIDQSSFTDWLNTHPIYFFGDGASKCRQIIDHPNAKFIDGVVPMARFLGEMGFVKWKNGQVEDIASYEPFYLKDFLIRKPITPQ